jgi:acetyl-CoA carboxylase biotin carboxyl carrier protein
VQEVLRSFARSDWTGMTLEIDGMRITVGKNGPPAGSAAVDGRAGTSEATPAPPTPTPPRGDPDSRAATPRLAGSGAAGLGGASAAPVDTTGLVEVRSPAVGAFWVAPSPGQAPFVEVGQVVGEHEQLAIVEVMKLMNPVVAAQPGEIVQVCANNAELVEYDQVLFLIRPSDG